MDWSSITWDEYKQIMKSRGPRKGRKERQVIREVREIEASLDWDLAPRDLRTDLP